jgi:hypothetical protein
VLSRQIQAIQQAMHDVMPNLPVEAERSLGFDAQAASVAIANLRALLESSDGDAVEALLALEDALAGNMDRLRQHALSAAISNFDFESALLKLDEIAKEYGANWEQTK